MSFNYDESFYSTVSTVSTASSFIYELVRMVQNFATFTLPRI